jgi:hypothetical protein
VKIGDLIQQLTEGSSDRAKVKAEIRTAKVTIAAFEREFEKVTAASSRDEKNRLEQHIDETIFALERAGKALRKDIG